MMTLGMTHFCNGMCVSLQAPFYPAEAEKKGATASEYGLVFGIFELTVFLVSPVIGRYLPQLGVNRAFSLGISTTGTMCILFGFLNFIEGPREFIGLSIAVRIVEAVGNSAFLTSSFCLVAQRFQGSIATVFSLVEMSFGLGMILGPTVGGALFQAGGYILPFLVLGCILLIQAFLSTLSLGMTITTEQSLPVRGRPGILKALTVPSVLLAVLAVFAASISIGFLQATLERHLAQFDLSPVNIGIFFMVYGASYAVLSPVWGWMADKLYPGFVILVGSMFLCVGLSLVGPLPCTGLLPSYNIIMGALVVAGVGLGAQLVSAFALAQRGTVSYNFPDDVTTYSLVSSLWTSAFALGAFVGPTTAGVLYDRVGFEWSTLFMVGWNVLVFVLMLITLLAKLAASILSRRRTKNKQYSRLREGSGCSSGYGSIKGCSPPPRRNTENGLFREIFPPAEVSPLVTREIHERLFEDIDTSESGIVSGNPPPPAVVGRAQPIWPAEGGRDTPSRHVVAEMRQSQESRYQTL